MPLTTTAAKQLLFSDVCQLIVLQHWNNPLQVLTSRLKTELLQATDSKHRYGRQILADH